MQLEDLIQLLREDFGSEVAQAQEALAAWHADSAKAHASAEVLRDFIGRSEQAAQLVGMEGFASFLQQISAFVRLTSKAPAHDVSALAWLEGWAGVAQAYLEAPGSASGADAVAQYLRNCPVATDEAAIAALHAQLLIGPQLSDDMMAEDNAPLPLATADDVSLQAQELDPQLFEAFLADAPDQVERLSQFTAQLARSGLALGELNEAQRIAHTFKGSGNIIGLPGIGRLAHRVEDVLEYAIECVKNAREVSPSMRRDAAHAVDCLAQMVGHLEGQDTAPAHAVPMLQRMLDWVTAIRSGEAQAFAPEPVAMAGMPAGTATQGGVAGASEAQPQPAPAATAAITPAVGSTGETLRVSADQISRFVRRAGQSLVFGDRFGQMLHTTVDRLNSMEVTHHNLARLLRELDLTVERQVVNLQDQKTAGENYDPLEMDRYDNMHLLTRQVAESVADELELAREARAESERVLAMLRGQMQGFKDQHRELLEARLVPVKTIVPRLKRNVAQTAATTGKQARLEVLGDNVTLDADVLQRLTEPLLHLLRNAVDHGIESPADRATLRKPPEGVVSLHFARQGQTVRLTCADDGKGLDLMAIYEKAVGFGLVDSSAKLSDDEIMRLILRPGFSTRDVVTETSGRGVGLDVVAERVVALKGRFDMSTRLGRGSQFTIDVPVSFGSVHAMVVRSEGELLAISADQIVVGLAAGQGEVTAEREALTLTYGDQRYPVIRLSNWAGFERALFTLEEAATMPVVVVNGVGGAPIALAVDAILESRELIVQELPALLRRVPGVVASSLRSDGRPLMLIDVTSMQRAAQASTSVRSVVLTEAMRQRMSAKRASVLIVDDALSVRKSMEQLLEDAGYEAITAIDGVQALERIRERKPTVILTDLEMPNMNGLELTRRVREVPDWVDLPIVMITSRATDKHRDLAIESGVDVFMTKPYTDAELVGRVRQLSGAASASVLLQ